MVKKILIIDPVSPVATRKLSQIEGVFVNYCPDISEDRVLEELKDSYILILRNGHIFKESWLNYCNELVAVIRAGEGHDNIPVEVLKRENIFFSNIPNQASHAVAEYALGLIITSLRNVFEGLRSIQNRKWEKATLVGTEIRGKTIGLIGYGKIGKMLATLLDKLDLDIKIIYCNKSGPVISKHQYADFAELASKSDVISIQVPLDDKTISLINNKFLSRLAKKPVIINLSRYEVIDMNDLVDAFKNGKIKSAFIDPFEKRFFDDAENYFPYPIYLLPHLGGNTTETQDRIGLKLVDIVKELLCKQPGEGNDGRQVQNK
jgi:D-3-phosphoglycerate dehydrogenase